jgi:hypothetical protein
MPRRLAAIELYVVRRDAARFGFDGAAQGARFHDSTLACVLFEPDGALRRDDW